MGDAQTDNPFIVLCPNAFQKKAINGNGATISIAELGDTVSYRMMPLGGTLLHEYMHFDKMTKALVGNSPIVDDINGYGPVGARNLDKSIALHNADSYLYYALETFWTTVASKDFGDPVPGVDDQDPVCGGSPCTG